MKLFYYVMIFVGIMMLFNAAGYSPPASGLVKSLIISDDSSGTGKLQDVENSSLWVKLLAVLAAAAAVGIVAGLYFNLPNISYLIAGFLTLFLAAFMIDLIWLYQKIIEHGDTWMVFVISTLFGPLLVGFIITAIEWWQGSD